MLGIFIYLDVKATNKVEMIKSGNFSKDDVEIDINKTKNIAKDFIGEYLKDSDSPSEGLLSGITLGGSVLSN